MDKWKWLIFAGLGVIVIGLLIITKPQTVEFEGDPAKVVAGDHVEGKRDAKVVLVEYADFQCPGCGALFSPLKEAKETYKEKVAFVYRYLPLTALHPNAKAAAAAAEAAGRQQKFWEMHDLLYASQNQWSEASASTRGTVFEGYAKQLSLNIEQYKEDVASAEVASRISRDLGAAQKAGIELSTPTLVLNGKTINNSDLSENVSGTSVFTARKIGELLDNALRQVGETPPASPTDKPTGEAAE